jgi:hypothetical protein
MTSFVFMDAFVTTGATALKGRTSGDPCALGAEAEAEVISKRWLGRETVA